jgi:hypothetical protein
MASTLRIAGAGPKPMMRGATPATAAATTRAFGELRVWWFALAFVCIGLETRFIELAATEQGRPALAFMGAQTINIFWTLLLAYLLFGGVIFPQPEIK